MKEIISQWGADYFRTDEEIKTEAKSLRSVQGIDINPGDKITSIGSRKRTQFELNDGLYMTYEGLIKYGNIIYALFNCPQHNEFKTDLFDNIEYRYAFACAFDHIGKLICFVLGQGGPNGCHDVVVDKILKVN